MDSLIGYVSLHSGLDEREAAAMVASVLAALRADLGRVEAEALADALPASLAAPLRQGRSPGGPSVAARVAAAGHIAPGRAVEHVACVLGALAARLPATTLERLRAALPARTAALLVTATAREPELEPKPHAARSTLAEGRPGSRHPLSEARPRGAQADSVVASDNPHGDTKLSSSRGLTQERERESLAVGRPGPRRPIAEAKERSS